MFNFCIKAALLMSSVCCGCCFGEVLRDPTQPLNFSGPSEGSLQLSSIFIGKDKKVAVINGVRLQEGEVLPGRPGVVVKKIDSREVIVVDGDESRSLHLAGSFRN